MEKFERTRRHKQFEGYTEYYSHPSKVCQTQMKFAIFVPPQAAHKPLPALYFLSGLTCSEEIFMTEAQAQSFAKKYGVILVVPDTSPRDTGIEGENGDRVGSGAGFYINATEKKWARHYQMDSYVTQELRELVESHFPVDPNRRGIFGHSMGGHGALVLGLRNPGLYQSISAFAPICNPTRSKWGRSAFTAYLGSDESRWAEYNATELVKKTGTESHQKSKTPILIDQGLEDEFLEEELFIDEFEQVSKAASYPAVIRRHPGYDHSYYFISTFIEDHIAFHAEILGKRSH